MACSTLFCKLLWVVFVCYFFIGLLFAQENNQNPSHSAIDGQGSLLFFYQKSQYPRDCSEVRDSCSSSVTSGVYLIKPDGYDEPFEAYCDNDIDSGGWTVILRRLDGSVDFNRNWTEYKKGFGFLSAECWVGNDKLSYLTNQAQYELLIDIALDNGTVLHESYNAFRISDEWSDYTITRADLSTSFTDCNDVYSAGIRQDGVYSIRPAGWDRSQFDVFCNMSVDGGNWTVIQRRVNGSTDFYRNWTSYKEGFGNIRHEFWLGNEKLFYLTNQATYEYRVDFVLGSSLYFNKWSRFRIGNETNKYKVTSVGSRTATRGYSVYNTVNRNFSTYDQDNDGLIYNCAEGHRSGWWHGANFYTHPYRYCAFFPSGNTNVRCSLGNLNGDYNGGYGKNIFDDHTYNTCYQKYVEIKIRRVS